MNGIKMSDCKFYVDENARVVICVIPNTKDILLSFITQHFHWKDIDLGDVVYYDLRNALELPSSFMGKAVCSPEDEWDEELGRMIAFSRAKDKCYKSFFRRANMLVQRVDKRLGDMITAFNDFGLKLETKREALTNQIESKTKKEGDA